MPLPLIQLHSVKPGCIVIMFRLPSHFMHVTDRIITVCAYSLGSSKRGAVCEENGCVVATVTVNVTDNFFGHVISQQIEMCHMLSGLRDTIKTGQQLTQICASRDSYKMAAIYRSVCQTPCIIDLRWCALQ